MAHFLDSAKSYAKFLLEDYPDLYLGLLKIKRARHWSQDYLISKDTDLVIEGFPRSANSFAVQAFKSAQNRELRIATHVHSPAHIIKACQLGIPTMVLIRKPLDAVVGVVAFAREISQRTGRPHDASVEYNLRYWCKFYRSIIPYRKHFLLAKFEDVTADFGRVMEQFNSQFGTEYQIFDHKHEQVQTIFDKSPFHLSPSEVRNSFKDAIKDEAKQHSGLLHEAKEIYKAYYPDAG